MPTLADVDNHPFGWRRDSPGRRGRRPQRQRHLRPRRRPAHRHHGQLGRQPAHGRRRAARSSSAACPIRECYDGLRNWNQVRPGGLRRRLRLRSYFPDGMASRAATEVDGLPCGLLHRRGRSPARLRDRQGGGQERRLRRPVIPSRPRPPRPCRRRSARPSRRRPHLVPAELTPLPRRRGSVRRRDAAAVRPQAGPPRPRARTRPRTSSCFTEVPKAGRVGGVVTQRPAPRVRPGQPELRGERRRVLDPDLVPRLRGQRGRARLHRRVGPLQRPRPLDLHHQRPAPQRRAPNMLTVCINDPGPIPDPDVPGEFIPDPWFDPGFTHGQPTP